MAISLLTRLILLSCCSSQANTSPVTLLATFATGFLYDAVVQCYLLVPLTVYLAFLTERFFTSRANKCTLFAIASVFNFIYLFNAVAEVVFWDEFGCRYNFIAVDYLAYTTEVIGNIWQSYPIVWIMLGVLAFAIGLSWLERYCSRRVFGIRPEEPVSVKCRLGILGTHLAVLLLTLLLSLDSRPSFGGNRFNRELSSSGIYSLAAAFRHNQLDYAGFYPTLPESEVDRLVREELSKDGGVFVSDTPLDIRRTISSEGPEHRWNVVLVLEESLSAQFSAKLSEQGKGLLPCFDQLAQNGMLLERCFASGTRTVRGIEAVQLSLPPTPGQSIVKRRNHEDMFSMGKVFAEHGYVNTFFYGGNGFFDNMNAFFETNGYAIQDCTSDLSEPKTFDTAWGYCDQDVYEWALAAGDRAVAAGKNFHHFILTTSNHRPYTFPEGVIDAPQKSRSSAVRYADFALGEFIRKAEEKPWFKDTLFVIVADHCHSTSGREALPLGKYHIPALFYNPNLVKPQVISTVCSQIDIAPTIFGLLNWTYVSQFYGLDVRRLSAESGRAFPGTFQNLGFLRGNTGVLTTLYPVRRHDVTDWKLTIPFTVEGTSVHIEDYDRSIAIYQSASIRTANRLDKAFTDNKKP